MDSVQVLSLIAAVASAIAALASCIAAFTMPGRMLKLSNQQKASEDQARTKMFILAELLRHRDHYSNAAAVSAINLIDIIFVDDPLVREARRQFMNAVNDRPFSAPVTQERFLTLVEKIIANVGMVGKISVDDVRSFYIPEVLAKQRMIEYKNTLDAFNLHFPEDGSAQDSSAPAPKKLKPQRPTEKG